MPGKNCGTCGRWKAEPELSADGDMGLCSWRPGEIAEWMQSLLDDAEIWSERESDDGEDCDVWAAPEDMI